jgi:ribosomal protein S6
MALDMETKEQKNYEISFLARGEEGAGAVVKHLHRLDAEILSEEGVGSINLAYPIKKHETAHFGCIHFKAGAETIKLLKEALKFEDDILRHLVVAPSFLKEGPPSFKQRSDVGEKKVSSERQVGEGGLSNEDLEIKLQEISESLPKQE